MRLAMLGGSFNPVHIGHLLLADEVCHRLGYDRVLFVPVNLPPHKELAAGATNRQRLEMLRLAVAGNSRFAVETCELERGGISYTYDTLVYLEEKYGRTDLGDSAREVCPGHGAADTLEGKIGLIMGDDLVDGFEDWGHYEELPRITDIVLARRICRDGSARKDFPYPHIELENGLFPVSSSQIRAAVARCGAAGGDSGGGASFPSASWRYLVPESVYRYIIQGNLYGCAAD